MRCRHWFILIACCAAVAPLTFGLGRWSSSTKRNSTTAQVRDVSVTPSSAKNIRAAEPEEFAQVIIENLGDVEFEHAYNLLRSAPKEALQVWVKRLEALPVGPRRTAGVEVFFKTLAQIDAKAAVDLALSMTKTDPRWTAIAAITRATPAVNLGEVARMYTALNEKKLGLGDFVYEWSRSDPVSTAEWISSYPGEVDNRDIASLMQNWAALDPSAAREWLAKAEPNRQDSDVYAGFYAGWAEADPAGAFRELNARGDDEKFTKAIETVAKEVFKDSPDSARTLVLTLPAGASQKSAVEGIVHDVTAVYLGGGPDLQVDEVAKWLVTLPENLWREEIGEVINGWRDRDGGGRETWLEQLPLQTRDRVLASYCKAYRSHIPTENFQAGLRISDPELRQQTFREIFGNMHPDMRQEVMGALQLGDEDSKALARILKRL